MNAALKDAEPKLPETVAAAVDCLLKEFHPAFLQQLKRTTGESLRIYHHEWGPIIQNRFGLEGRNEPLLEDCQHIYGIRMRSRYMEFELKQLSQVKSLMPNKSAFVVILESLRDRLHAIEDEKRRAM